MVARLRRVSSDVPGITRHRRGRGFTYRDPRGRPVSDPETLERVRTLAVPPAWSDVWICEDAWGHLQAVGTDAAGRRQYRYHDRWRRRRDAQKFEREYLIAVVDREQYWQDESGFPFRNPQFYSGALDPDVYVVREYAPLEERMLAYIAYAKAIPKALEGVVV